MLTNKLRFIAISFLALLMSSGCSSPKRNDSRIEEAVKQSLSYDYQGPKLIAKPYSQNKDGKVNNATFTFELIGLALEPGENYILSINNMAKDTISETMFTVDDSLNLVSVEENLKLEEIPAAFNGFLSGEFCNIVLMEEVSDKAAVCHFAPKPLESSLGSKKIEAELKMVDGSIYALKGSGFESNENIKVASISGSERIEYTIKANSAGIFYMQLLPISAGCRNGSCSVKFSTMNNEVIEIKLPYGETLLRTMYNK